MKKITAALVAFTMAFTLVGCGGGNSDTSTTNENETDTGTETETETNETAVNETEKECIAAIQAGIQKRCDIISQDYDTYDEYKANVKQGIGEELNAVKGYKDADFDDKKMTETVNSYITALEKESEGADQMVNGDVAKYNQLYFREGNDKRKEALQYLIENHNLVLDDKHESDFELLKKNMHYESINYGQTVTAKTAKGNVNITIDSVKKGASAFDEPLIIILCQLDNLSYFTTTNDSAINIGEIMFIADQSGVLLSPAADGHTYPGYVRADVRWARIKPGQNEKFNFGFSTTQSTNCVHIVIPGDNAAYDMYVPV